MRSAFFVDSISAEQIQSLVEHAKLRGLKIPTDSFYSEDSIELKTKKDLVFIAAFARLNETNEEVSDLLLSKCQNLQIPLFVFAKHEPARRNSFATYSIVPDINAPNLLTPLLFHFVPPGFKIIAMKGSEFIGNSMFPDMDMKFAESETPKVNAKLLVTAEIADKSFLSTIAIAVALDDFKSRNSLYSDIDDATLIDAFKEFANQLIGIINFNLARIEGLHPRGSLPMAIYSSSGYSKRTDLFFRPCFLVSNSAGDVQIRFDMLNLKGLDLSLLFEPTFQFMIPEETAEFF